MRILANYGYKANGDTYSVTFETMGDVPKEQAHDVVDELFRMAKTAIQRQIQYEAEQRSAPCAEKKTPARPEEVIIPQQGKVDSGNSRTEGHGLVSGNQSHKPRMKDPKAPATKKQKSLIIRLAKENGKFVENLNLLTMREAIEKIDELMALSA